MNTTIFKYLFLHMTILSLIGLYSMIVNLASSNCSDKIKRNMYFTINMAFAHQLLTTFSEVIHPDDIDSEKN